MRYLENEVTLQYDDSRCNGCARCTEVCPHAVWKMVDKRALLADRGACMECGACANNCEQQSITVRAGVGCAAGVLAGVLTGREPTCGCSGDDDAASSCCG